VIFDCQNGVLVAGNAARLQPAWPCQKQPLTNIAVRHSGTTMSGLPGRDAACNRSRNPFLRRKTLTVLSGAVCTLRMRDMISLRSAGETISTIGLMDSTAIGRQNLCRPIWNDETKLLFRKRTHSQLRQTPAADFTLVQPEPSTDSNCDVVCDGNLVMPVEACVAGTTSTKRYSSSFRHTFWLN
jgi:hypothetical protein